MVDITDQLASLASPQPLPPGQNDYGALAYLVWAGCGAVILAGLYVGVRVLGVRVAGRLAARRARRGENA